MFSSNTTQTSGGYEIQRSLRFNSADSAHLERTPASSGNRRTWTWSGWVKKTAVGDGRYPALFGAQNTTRDVLRFNGEALNVFFNNTSSANLVTVPVYRDASAWYHVVLAVDTTQATDTNRVKIYVNGVQVTSFSTASYPAQNYDTFINMNVVQKIGSDANLGDGYLNGYLTEINFIDGQALTPSSFGETNADTGVWQPKRYAGSYGTNGFYLNFSDNSNATATTLGKDYSGNGNNWSLYALSVSAGAGNDSLVDVPTNWGVDTGVGGTVRGNYCTLNPLTTTSGTYTQGNLRYTGPSSWRRSNATISRSTGQWYWEVTLGNAPFATRNGGEWNAFGFGVATSFGSTTTAASVTDALILADNGYYKNFSGSFTDGGTAFASGDVLSVAVDLDANTFTFRRNNTSLVTGTIGGTAGQELVPIIMSYDGAFGVMDCNFGQRPFAYTAPSGFKALNTQNLPTPTIGATPATQANKFFDVTTYTGNGSSLSITNSGSMQPDLVWGKNRASAVNHGLIDSVRGVSRWIGSNVTDAEGYSPGFYVTAFNSSGFTVGDGSVFNTSGSAYVAWQWKANGAGVTNTAGSITSTVSANTTSGFSVVTFTGNNSTATVGHGLGNAPAMYIVKGRSNAGGWVTYHRSLGATQFLTLQSTDAATTSSNPWNNTAPTSSVFTIGSGSFGNTNTYVAYCFAEVAGFSKFGSYTGNGSSSGPFIYCGFRPAFIMIKNAGSTGAWCIFDARRNPSNGANFQLQANSSNAEGAFSVAEAPDLLSNGFKLNFSYGDFNSSGVQYVFMALAEAPQKFALAR